MESDAEPNGLHADIWWPLISRQLDGIGDRESLGLGSIADPVRAILGRLRFDALTAFEFSLSANSERIFLPDISQKIERPDQADLILQSWSPRPLPWKDLLRTWAGHNRRPERDLSERPDSSADFLSAIDSVWLELDLARMEADGSLAEPPAQSTPTHVGPALEPHPVVCLTLPRRRRPLNMADGLSLFGRLNVRAQAATLSRCLEKLPPGSRPQYLFDLAARCPGWVRLEIFGVAVPDMPGYLKSIGVRPPGWLEVLGPAGRESDRPHLSFDIGPAGEIGPRIGVEISYARLPSREPRWLELMNELTAAGLFDAGRRRLVHDWLGQWNRATAGYLWPSTLHRGVAAQVLSHFKLAGPADASPPEAKGYLLFQYRAVTT